MSDEDNSFTAAMLVIGAVFVIGLVGWGVRACVLAQDATLGKAEQKVQTENYEQSVAYREGTRRDFDELVRQYRSARSQDERDAVKSIMRHRAAGCPSELVTHDVKEIIQ